MDMSYSLAITPAALHGGAQRKPPQAQQSVNTCYIKGTTVAHETAVTQPVHHSMASSNDIGTLSDEKPSAGSRIGGADRQTQAAQSQ